MNTNALPRISIVTPSFNQAPYLEAALRSVLDCNYANLEYVVIDGGSTDGSVDIIRRYQDRLAYWVSERDGGQYDAINRGFARTSGEIMAWLNSDDKYTPWALDVVARAFSQHPEIDWLTTSFPLNWDQHGVPVRCALRRFDRRGVLRGAYLPCPPWHGVTCIQQESTFWRRRLWDQTGGRVAAELKYAGDFELWVRFAQQAEIYNVPVPLAGFRRHGNQKTGYALKEYFAEADAVLRELGRRPPLVRNLWTRFIGKAISVFTLANSVKLEQRDVTPTSPAPPEPAAEQRSAA